MPQHLAPPTLSPGPHTSQPCGPAQPHLPSYLHPGLGVLSLRELLSDTGEHKRGKVQSQCHSISDVGRGGCPYLWVGGKMDDKPTQFSNGQAAVTFAMGTRSEPFTGHSKENAIWKLPCTRQKTQVLTAQILSSQTWDPVPELQTLVKILSEPRFTHLWGQEMQQFYYP